jgi:adenylate kinase family enzyme
MLGGPPGAGKSTVAESFASAAPPPTVHLHTDSFYVWIRSGYVVPYLPEAERQNEVVTTVMIESALAYAHGGYDVVLDGILGPWLLAPFQAACRRAQITLSYVVLRPSLDIALERATGRAGRHLTKTEPIIGLYGAFAELGTLESHVVDSSTQTVGETVECLRVGLRQRRFTLA